MSVKPIAAPASESVLRLPVFSGVDAGASPDATDEILDLFDRYAPPLLRYVGSFGLCSDEAEDIVQETFLALSRHVFLGRDRTKIGAWLFQVAHNLTLKRRRTIQRRPPHDPLSDTHVDRHLDPALDPEAQLIESERRRRLHAVVNALSARERRCLLLRAEGLTYREIAMTLSVSLGAVAKSIARAMTRLITADGGK